MRGCRRWIFVLEVTTLFPEILSAPDSSTDLPAYLESRREDIDLMLRDVGALLFRGFPVRTAEDFQVVVRSSSQTVLSYTYRSSPRTEQITGIYTSTEYPPTEEIPLHNENSYAHTWPLRIWFFCQQPATAGGATIIADSRDVASRLDPALVRRFTDLGVMYLRNYRPGMDLSWQEVFQTKDKADVERFCDEAGITCEWRGKELRTRQVCQGVAKHPQTGSAIWFNQAHLFHPTALEEEVRETLLELFGQEGLPRYACYGDGSPIADKDLAAIRDAYQAGMVDVAWEQGDVLLLDNMLVAHGRRPYSPPRRVLVAMTDSLRFSRQA
jgi:alpha-ketoglutarate-dependent taurine dioxygenase